MHEVFLFSVSPEGFDGWTVISLQAQDDPSLVYEKPSVTAE